MAWIDRRRFLGLGIAATAGAVGDQMLNIKP